MSIPTKNNPAAIIVLLLLSALAIFSSEATIDAVLVPRQIIIGVGIILLNIFIPRKGKTALNFGLIAYAVFWCTTLLAHISAINATESLATLSRLSLWFGVLITFYRLFQAGILTMLNLSKTLSILGLVSLLFAAKQFSNHNDVYEIVGRFGHKNFFASALMLTLPFSLYLFLNEKKGGWKIVGIASGILVLITLFYLRTRGVWLGITLGFSGLIIALLSAKEQFKKVVIPLGSILFGLGIIIIGLSLNQPKVQEKILDGKNIQNRIKMWDHGLKMTLENPITGVGGGNWKIHYPKYGLDENAYRLNQGSTSFQRPHNDFIWTFSEFGFMGGLFYLGFFGLLVFQSFKLGQGESGEEKNMALAFLFGILAYTGYSLGEFPMERPFHSFVLMMMAGWVFSKLKPIRYSLNNLVWVIIPIALGMLGTYVGMKRFSGEKHAKKMLEYNQKQQPGPMMRESQAAQNEFFNMDNFANPLPYFQGMSLLAQRKFEASRPYFKEALEEHPYHILSWVQLAQSYKYTNQNEEALKHFDEVLAFAPSNEMANLSKAEIFIRTNQYPKAIELLLGVRLKNENQNQKFLQMAAAVGRWALQQENLKGKPKFLKQKLGGVNATNPQAIANQFIQIRKDL